MILSILVPAEAVNAARTVKQALRDTDMFIFYMDCNAISPATSLKIDEIVRGAGSRYVDASIIGPRPEGKGSPSSMDLGPTLRHSRF